MPYSANNSATRAISFRPATLNVLWDGKSEARAVIDLACLKTASTYAAYVYPIASTTETVSCGTASIVIGRGERKWYCNAGTLSARPNSILPITASISTVKISISSITSTYGSSVSGSYAWWLEEVKASGSRTLVAGRIDSSTFDPYTRTMPTVLLASASTSEDVCG